jgi:hypothetical protein
MADNHRRFLAFFSFFVKSPSPCPLAQNLGSKIIIFGIAKKTKKSLFAFQNLGGELKRGENQNI